MSIEMIGMLMSLTDCRQEEGIRGGQYQVGHVQLEPIRLLQDGQLTKQEGEEEANSGEKGTWTGGERETRGERINADCPLEVA